MLPAPRLIRRTPLLKITEGFIIVCRVYEGLFAPLFGALTLNPFQTSNTFNFHKRWGEISISDLMRSACTTLDIVVPAAYDPLSLCAIFEQVSARTMTEFTTL